MPHVVLLGDSIFDNAAYVPDGPPVIEQLRSCLPSAWKAARLAIDGAVIADVADQLRRLPEDVTHLIVSVGGNDALEHSALVEDVTCSAAEGFERLALVQQQFRLAYQEMLQAVLQEQKPIALCTIYDAIPGLPEAAVAGLSAFNDAILREGFRRGLPMVDLRLICNEPGDFSTVSFIEPSEKGGAKVVQAIRRLLLDHDFSQKESVIYV